MPIGARRQRAESIGLDATHGTRGERWVRLAIGVAVAAPFVPALVAFLRAGVPDVLFSGDAAALELGTLHAAKSVQYLGPYSRFGWNHPGPLFFYLAMPLYEALGQRGPALNLFALLTNFLASIAMVFTAVRLHGRVMALGLAALLAVFDLVAAPYLLTNEWNPIWPMLWFGLFTLLAARLALGVRTVLPAVVFVGSLIVQTHVGYALEVLAVMTLAGIHGGVFRRQRESHASIGATVAVVLVCWSLPVVESVTRSPGNLQQLATFFAPTARHLAQQSWQIAFATVAQQLAAAPWALVKTLVQRDLPAPGVATATPLAFAQVLCVGAVLVHARHRGDQALSRFCELVLIEVVAAAISIRAIRGDVAFYLVAWCSVIGVMALAATTTAILVEAGRAAGLSPAIPVAAALVITGLAVRAPVSRAGAFTPAPAEAEQTAVAVADFLRAHPNEVPVVSIASPDRWPIAVAAVLHLSKRGVAVWVDPQWLHIVGRQFAAPPGPHPRLVFGDGTFAVEARRSGLVQVSMTQDVSVFYAKSS
jgi:hypothetical protein